MTDLLEKKVRQGNPVPHAFTKDVRPIDGRRHPLHVHAKGPNDIHPWHEAAPSLSVMATWFSELPIRFVPWPLGLAVVTVQGPWLPFGHRWPNWPIRGKNPPPIQSKITNSVI